MRIQTVNPNQKSKKKAYVPPKLVVLGIVGGHLSLDNFFQEEKKVPATRNRDGTTTKGQLEPGSKDKHR
jgi:hypothetical protein